VDKNKSLCITLLIIGIIVILLTIYCISGLNIESLTACLENMLSEVLGILLTVLIVDFLLNKKEINKLNQTKKLMLNQLKTPLLQYLTLLYELYDSLNSGFSLSSMQNFTDSKFLQKIKEFDFSKKNPFSDISWKEYFFKYQALYKENLSDFLWKNHTYLDPILIDNITKIINSPLVELKNVGGTGKNILNSDVLINLFEKELKNYTELLSIYNNSCLDIITLDFVKSNYNIKKTLLGLKIT